MSDSRVTRRRFLTGLGVGVASVLVAACSQQATPTETSPPASQPTSAASSSTAAPAQEASNGTKSVAGEMVWLVRSSVVENKGQEEIFEPLLKEQLPDVKVNRVVVPETGGGYSAKILTLAAAKQGMDLWGFGQNYFDYWARGMPQNLNEYISADKWDIKNYFQPGLTDIYNIKGNQYGLPQLTCFGTICVYNKDLLDEAGLAYPPVDWEDQSWNWDKVLEYATKLSKNVGKPDQVFGMSSGFQRLTVLSYLWGDDTWLPEHYTNLIAPKSNFANEANITGHQFFHDLMYKHKVHPDPAATEGLAQLGNPFQTGRVAMDFNGGWLYWTARAVTAFKVGYAAFPYAKTNKQVNYNDQWIMARWSTVKDAVWAVMRVLTSVEATTKYSELSGTPPTPRESLEPWLQKLSEFTGQSIDDLRTVTTGGIKAERTQESPDHMFLQWPSISGTYTNEMDAFWNDPNATADQMWPKITEAIDKAVAEAYNQFNGKLPAE